MEQSFVKLNQIKQKFGHVFHVVVQLVNLTKEVKLPSNTRLSKASFMDETGSIEMRLYGAQRKGITNHVKIGGPCILRIKGSCLKASDPNWCNSSSRYELSMQSCTVDYPLKTDVAAEKGPLGTNAGHTISKSAMIRTIISKQNDNHAQISLINDIKNGTITQKNRGTTRVNILGKITLIEPVQYKNSKGDRIIIEDASGAIIYNIYNEERAGIPKQTKGELVYIYGAMVEQKPSRNISLAQGIVMLPKELNCKTLRYHMKAFESWKPSGHVPDVEAFFMDDYAQTSINMYNKAILNHDRGQEFNKQYKQSCFVNVSIRGFQSNQFYYVKDISTGRSVQIDESEIDWKRYFAYWIIRIEFANSEGDSLQGTCFGKQASKLVGCTIREFIEMDAGAKNKKLQQLYDSSFDIYLETTNSPKGDQAKQLTKIVRYIEYVFNAVDNVINDDSPCE